MADVPRNVRLELARDQADRLPHDISRRQRVRGRLPVRGLPGRSGLGREHVRGADAGACSSRRRNGARGAGRSITRSRSPPRSTTASSKRSTATGGSRPRTSPKAATPSMASTPSGWTRQGTSRTTTTPTSTAVSPAAPAASRSLTHRRPRTRTASSPRTPHSWPCAGRRTRVMENLANLEADFDIYERVGVPRLGQRRYGRRLRRIPVARPGHHHGRDRQRPRGRRPARIVRDQGLPQGPPAGDRHGDVQRRSAEPPPKPYLRPCDRRGRAPRGASSARIAWFETFGASTERDRPAPDVDPAAADRGPRRAWPRPGDGVVVTGRGRRRLPRPSRSRPSGDLAPIDHKGGDVLAVPHGPYVDTTLGVEGDNVYAVASLSSIDAPVGPVSAAVSPVPAERPGRGERVRSMPRARRARSSGRGGR